MKTGSHGTAVALAWIARGWSAISVALLVAFVVGEGIAPGRGIPARPAEWLGFLFFPLGVAAGMIIAWWREACGGAITIGSLAAFYLVHLSTAGVWPRGAAWILFAAPGFLFLLSSFARRRSA